MKGLLEKDFRLLMQRKRFFLVMAVCALFMGFTMDGTGFVVGWICVLMAVFSLSSLSYDEYDNSLPFLMSMPVSAKEYALEKYVFGILCGLTGWLFAIIVELIIVFLKRVPVNIGEELLSSAVYIPMIMLVLAVSLPVELKWGAEKGRTFMLIVFGFLFACMFAIMKILPGGSSSVDAYLESINAGIIFIVVMLTAIILTVISMLISVRVFTRKEF